MSQTVVKSKVPRRGLYWSFMRLKGMVFFSQKETPVVVATLPFLGCLGGRWWGEVLGEVASEWCFRISTFPGRGSVVITDTQLPVRLGRRWDGKEGGGDLF